MREPLVSVIVTNHNYGIFLERCIESVLNQTYTNIELIFCDNASTDHSFEIISRYIKISPDRVTLYRSNSNLGSSANYITGEKLIRGEYFINLGADDYLELDYISTAIDIFHNHKSVSQIISHADSIDDNGVISRRPAFFDGSYFIPGLSYAPILMVAGVTSHTSQTIFSSAAHFLISSQPDYIRSHTIGERTMAMMHAVIYDVVYLNKSFVKCRDSSQNETSRLNLNGSQIIEQLSVISGFYDYAVRHKLNGVYRRKEEALKKLSEICIRYAAHFYRLGNTKAASNYLGMALFLEGSFDNVLTKNKSDISYDISARIDCIVESIRSEAESSQHFRKNSYPPPDGSVVIEI